MGWGLKKDDRERFLKDAFVRGKRVEDRIRESEYLIFDMCAVMRYYGAGYERSISGIVNTFLKKYLRIHEEDAEKTFIMLFDDQNKLPPERAKVAEKRSRTATEKSLAAMQKHNAMNADRPKILHSSGGIFFEGEEPYSEDDEIWECFNAHTTINWRRVWGASYSKHRMFDKMYDVLRAEFETSDRLNGVSCILWRHGDVPHVKQSYTYDGDLEELARAISQHRFGEGDLRVHIAAAHIPAGKDFVIATNDTDQIIQVVMNEFQTGERKTLELLKSGALDIDLLHSQFLFSDGNIQGLKYTTAFLMMCAGGSDYCKGLTPFGYFMKDIVDMCQKLEHHYSQGDRLPFSRRDGRIVINVGHLCHLLKLIKRARKKNDDKLEMFNDEFNCILFNTIYFSGYDAHRGGPLMYTFTLADGVDTISEFLQSERPLYGEWIL